MSSDRSIFEKAQSLIRSGKPNEAVELLQNLLHLSQLGLVNKLQLYEKLFKEGLYGQC